VGAPCKQLQVIMSLLVTRIAASGCMPF